MRRWLFVAAVAVVVIGELAATHDDPLTMLTDAAAGVTFLAVGISQWRSSRRHATLAFAAGLAWFAGAIFPGALWLHRPLMLHASLAFPSGRLPGRAARVAVVLAWPAAVVPTLARSSYVSLVLAAASASLAWHIAGTASMGRLGAARHAAGSTALFAAALALPAADRLVSPDLTVGLSPNVVYAFLLALSGLLLLTGRPQQQRETDVVIELTQDDPANTLQALRQEVPVRRDTATRAALEAAIGLLETNLALHAELAEKVVDVRSSRRRLVEAAVSERRRLEQQLSAGALRYLDELNGSLDQLRSSGDVRVAELASRSAHEASRTRGDLEQLARGLHPKVLGEHGLAGALAELAQRSPVPTTVTVSGQRFPELVESTVWYACAEAMANLVKHSAATSAHVEVQVRGGALTACVSDDGIGGAQVTPHGGLAGLADRLGAVDGRLDMESPQGGGTRLTIEVPLP
ncbi:MAG: hypothetical protein H0U35_08560 [Sporichthyaceae bacterium]|nr:hypothetical protein [Sporichthyaceae bacterium]